MACCIFSIHLKGAYLLKFSVLAENKARLRGFLAEHGLSLYIQHGDVNVLFDTGQTDVYLKNAKALGIDLCKTSYIALSHGHYDHCGGLPNFPFESNKPNIYIQKGAFQKKYAINSDNASYREVGIDWHKKNYPQIISNDGDISLGNNITLVGNITSGVDFEEIPKGFFTKDNPMQKDMQPDVIDDEQMLVIDTEKGLCIFLGCSHKGIINCVNHALNKFPNKKIYTLVAGMHLSNATDKRISQTIESLKRLDIENIYPLHCTGICAIMQIKQAFGNRCKVLYSGDVVEL